MESIMETSMQKYDKNFSNQNAIRSTMHELLEERVKMHPNREMHVFVSDNERLNFVDFHQKVVQLASGLLEIGLSNGDYIAIIGHNHMEWPLIAGATRAIGVTTVFLQTGYPMHIIGDILRKTSCKALFLTRSPVNLYTDICKLIPELSSSTSGSIMSNKFPDLKYVVATDINHQSGTTNLEDLYIAGHEDTVKEASKLVTLGEIYCVLMTSGSTGPPKLVKFSHFRMLNPTCGLFQLCNENEEIKFVCCGSMSFLDATFQTQVCPLLIGSTCIYPKADAFDCKKLLQSIHDERATHITLVLNWLIQLVYDPTLSLYDLSSLKAGIVTGSPIPPEVAILLSKKLNIDVMNSYGLTEIFDATGVIVQEGHKSNTVGKPIGNNKIKIVDESGHPVKSGEEGRVLVQSDIAFEGYFDARKTKDVMTPDGWFRTGDIGKLDQDGYLTITGRMKDRIIRSGLNIYPFPMEKALLSHSAIRNIQIVGIPDYRYGEDVCACVILNPGCTFTVEDIEKHCVDKLFVKSLPKYCLEFDEFPKVTTGKIDRKKLREMAIGRITVPTVP
ncbi:medium-chain acyl-CoA ligase ACSF2, mitochondrial-like [Antedon mediterranea]|uniref:medium-chain acyl-CoA ligase ACSF2, mitochondrial-like n=1 Tax=Antedon mediterranea TaxID=105859 RepID=UPI003AF5DB2D